MQVVLIILLLFLNFELFSQSSSTFTEKPNNESKINDETFLGLKKYDATNAMICSIIPGGGQIYNESYWKAGLLFGAGVALTANLIYNDNQFVETRELIASGNYSGVTLDNLNRLKEDYRDTRDRTGFFILVLYLASTVDAYVGAKLSEFDVNDELSFYMNATPLGVQAGIKINFYSIFK